MLSSRKETTSEQPTVTVSKAGFDRQELDQVKNGDPIPFNNVTGAPVNLVDEGGVFGKPKATITLQPGLKSFPVVAPDPDPGVVTEYDVDDESAAKEGRTPDDPMVLKIKMGGGGGDGKNHPPAPQATRCEAAASEAVTTACDLATAPSRAALPASPGSSTRARGWGWPRALS